MVSVSKIINLPKANTPFVKHAAKIMNKPTAVLGSIAVLAGAGMGGAVAGGTLPNGASETLSEHVPGTSLNDPLLEQLAHGVDQIKEIGSTFAEGVSSTLEGAAIIADITGDAIVDGFNTVTDKTANLASEAADKIVDLIV